MALCLSVYFVKIEVILTVSCIDSLIVDTIQGLLLPAKKSSGRRKTCVQIRLQIDFVPIVIHWWFIYLSTVSWPGHHFWSKTFISSVQKKLFWINIHRDFRSGNWNSSGLFIGRALRTPCRLFPRNKLKKDPVSKIVLTFHCSNKLF